MDVHMTDAQIADIDKQIASLEAKRKALLDESRQEALTATRATVAKYGFTASELGVSNPKPAKAGTDALKAKAPAKYANPTNPSQTWAGGKGARPTWVKTHLDAGKSLDDLLIK